MKELADTAKVEQEIHPVRRIRQKVSSSSDAHLKTAEVEINMKFILIQLDVEVSSEFTHQCLVLNVTDSRFSSAVF